MDDPYGQIPYADVDQQDDYTVQDEEDETEQTMGQLIKKKYGQNEKKIKMTVQLAEKASYQKSAQGEHLRQFGPRLISLFLSNKGYTNIVKINKI